MNDNSSIFHHLRIDDLVSCVRLGQHEAGEEHQNMVDIGPDQLPAVIEVLTRMHANHQRRISDIERQRCLELVEGGEPKGGA